MTTLCVAVQVKSLAGASIFDETPACFALTLGNGQFNAASIEDLTENIIPQRISRTKLFLVKSAPKGQAFRAFPTQPWYTVTQVLLFATRITRAMIAMQFGP